MANIKICDELQIGKKSPNIDARYGPWPSRQKVIEVLGREGWDTIAEGLTVGIVQNNKVVEYWFQGGTDLDHLVLKNNGEGGSGSIEGAELQSNKVTHIRTGINEPEGSSNAPSNINYPSERAVALAYHQLEVDIRDIDEEIGNLSHFRDDQDYNPDPNNLNVADILKGLQTKVIELNWALEGTGGNKDSDVFNGTPYRGYSVWKVLGELYNAIQTQGSSLDEEWKTYVSNKLNELSSAIENALTEIHSQGDRITNIENNGGNANFAETIADLQIRVTNLENIVADLINRITVLEWSEPGGDTPIAAPVITLAKTGNVSDATQRISVKSDTAGNILLSTTEGTLTPEQITVTPNVEQEVRITGNKGINAAIPVITLTKGTLTDGSCTFTVKSSTAGTIGLSASEGTLSSTSVSVAANTAKTITVTNNTDGVINPTITAVQTIEGNTGATINYTITVTQTINGLTGTASISGTIEGTTGQSATASENISLGYVQPAPSEMVTATFVANGGTSEVPSHITTFRGDFITMPPSMTRNEDADYTYSQMFWGTTPTASSGYAANEPCRIDEDTTFYAIWLQIPKRVMSFNANGGQGTQNTIKIAANSDFTVPQCNFTKSGYTFTKWAKNSVTGTTYDAGDIITNVNEDITFYALWEELPPNTYTVQLIVEGGGGGLTKTVNEGESVQFTNVIPDTNHQAEGVTVSGNATIDGSTVTVTNVTQNTVITVTFPEKQQVLPDYVEWTGMSLTPSSGIKSGQQVTLNKGTITLHNDDGSTVNVTNNRTNIKFSLLSNRGVTIDDAPAVHEMDIDNTSSSTVTFNVPTDTNTVNYRIKVYYVLDGVYYETRNVFLDFSAEPSIRTYTVTVHPDSHTTLHMPTSDTRIVNEGEDIYWLVETERGWKLPDTITNVNDVSTDTSGVTRISIDNIHSDLDIYLNCIEQPTINVIYDVNGGSHHIDTVSKYPGDEIVIPTYAGTKAGHTLKGTWSINGVEYPFGSYYTIGEENITLVLNWQAEIYSVTIDVINGTPETINDSIPYNESRTYTITPNTGYRLPDTIRGFERVSDTQVRLNNVQTDLDLTIECELIPVQQYTVSYNANGGNSTPSSQTVNANSPVTLANAITRNEDSNYTYTFAGWKSSIDNSVKAAGSSYTVNANVTFTAQWTMTPKETPQPSNTYYWYVGQTDPSTMSSTSPVVTDTSSPGWREIGTTLPTYSSSNMLWNGDNNNIMFENRDYHYLAIPSNNIKIWNGLGGSEMSSYSSPTTKSINGITYYIYKSNSKGRSFILNLYN